MNGQIKFFPYKFTPSQETLRQLAIAQEQLYYAHIELRFQYRHLPPWQHQLAKMRYHHGFRERWKIIQGDSVKSLHYGIDTDPKPA